MSGLPGREGSSVSATKVTDETPTPSQLLPSKSLFVDLLEVLRISQSATLSLFRFQGIPGYKGDKVEDPELSALVAWLRCDMRTCFNDMILSLSLCFP